MSKKLYIIRHGQTDLNLRGIVQGKGIDSPLNDTGRAQADAFYQAYKDEGFDKIYTSNLIRTHQTVAGFIADGIPWEQHEGFSEIGWGIYEGKEQTPEVLAGFLKLTDAWRAGNLDSCVEGGETPNELAAKQREAIAHLSSKEEEKKVLICMHGRAIRIFLSVLTGGDLALMDDFPHTNTVLYKVVYDGRKFTIVDAYNVKHLEGLEY